jgi:hypothetical protein
MTDILWGPNIATVGTAVMSGDSPAINTSLVDMVLGSPTFTPGAAGAFTFSNVAFRAMGGHGKSFRVPLTVPLFTFTDDRSVQIKVHIHVPVRPVGNKVFDMAAPPYPSLTAMPWNDNYSDQSLPSGSIARKFLPLAEFSPQSVPAEQNTGNPDTVDYSWLMSRDEAVALFSGPNPSLLIDIQHGMAFVEADMPAVTIEVSDIAVRVLDAAGGTPSELHFRDPADGLFKPLTGIQVRGFPAPDLGDAVIGWGTERIATLHDPSLFVPPFPGIGVTPSGMPPEANARVSMLPNGRLRMQADAWHYSGTSQGGFIQSQDPNPLFTVRVPITWDPGIGVGQEMIRLLWTLKNNAGGSVITTSPNRTVGYYPVLLGLAKPGSDASAQPNPANYLMPAIGAETTGVGVQDILGTVAVQHDHVVVGFYPRFIEGSYADGSHPLAADLPAVDLEVDYLLVRQVAVLP